MDFARRIVSGKKARFTDASLNLDLDLVQLTDRIILMGYPATGSASLYRNQRKDVLKFLANFIPNSDYMIMNLCPRYENEYDADEFPGLVRRSPWPDHYPPPLSLLPVMVNRIHQFMDQSEDNVLIIHCKAGKGRSGTCALSYLLSQPGLPSAPAIPGSEAIDPRPVTPQREKPMTTQDKLDFLFDFHTSRRMAPGTSSRGVSISSQRRWLRYWARILDGDDPRASLLAREPTSIRTARLVQIRVLLKDDSAGWSRKLFGDHTSIQVYRYKDSIATSLRERELALKQDNKDEFDDKNWDDESEMIVRVANFKELSDNNSTAPLSANPSGAATPNTVPTTPIVGHAPSSLDEELSRAKAEAKCRTLSCSAIYRRPCTTDDVQALSKDHAKASAREQQGLEVDIDREVEFKLLLGKSGSAHGALPAMAALGIIWIVPSFEGVKASSEGQQRTVTVPASEIDFLKPQAHILAVELDFV
ncbi:hypothetical protein ACM66B_004334 [Microbotryomycetes sp. NB124-2]